MSTNKTQNYQFHAWAPEDEHLRTELNANFTKLDTALKAEETARAAAAQNEAAARTAAVNALNTAVGKKAEVVTGFYIGATTANSGTRHFDLGFRPKAVILGNVENFNATGILAVDPTVSVGTHRMTIDNTGFTIIHSYSGYNTDANGVGYVYLALR